MAPQTFMLKLFKKHKLLIIVILLSIPLFFRMLKFGMYSTQDFHLFRLHQFDKCIQNFQIPCRWAPDAGLSYGEPIFNFYGQLSYLIGEVYYKISGSLINSVKFLFIFSLVGSGISMYLLAKKLWMNEYSALISSLIYLYAPYRSVDVWVRGALPEAMSFVIFPIVILSIEYRSFFLLSISSAVLILNHNLSFIIFLPLIIIWLVYRKYWKGFICLVVAAMLSAYYILPVIFESKFINLNSTISGYFDFHNHFVELRQLLLSNYWGYGASVWGNGDGLSLAIGYVQWILPILILIYLFIKKSLFKQKEYLLLIILGWFALFLTHNKSTPIWEILPFMKYIQFPWRFLGIALFCFSLSSGLLINLVKNKYVLSGILVLVAYSLMHSASNFRPDIWYPVDDNYYLTGAEWDRQRTASIGDFWPKFGHAIPETPGDGQYINYFPGWNKEPNSEGLISSNEAFFSNTPVRSVGNIISIVSILGLIIWRKKLE